MRYLNRTYRLLPTQPDVSGKTIVAIAGTVPASLPLPHIPEINFAWIPELSSSALAIAFLGLLEALAIAKSIANHTGQKLDYNRQCLAEGIANLVGGFFRCLPGSGSLSRSAINFQAGAATRTSGIVTALAVAIALLAQISIIWFGAYAWPARPFSVRRSIGAWQSPDREFDAVTWEFTPGFNFRHIGSFRELQKIVARLVARLKARKRIGLAPPSFVAGRLRPRPAGETARDVSRCFLFGAHDAFPYARKWRLNGR